MQPGSDEQFLSEPIVPLGGTADTNAMARGEPGLPKGFVWHGQEYRVAEVLERWKSSGPMKGGQSMYLRRHWWKVRLEPPLVLTIYFERQAQNARRPKARWWVYSMHGDASPAPAGAASTADAPGGARLPAVRPARADDLDALLELYRHLHAKDDPPPAREALDALWQSILANPMLRCFVIERDGRLVASCTLTIIPNLTRGCRPYGLIENVVTHAEYRRRGLGTAVLQEALRCAWEAGCYKVMLMTGRKDAGTHRFYQRAGFRADEKTSYIARPDSQAPQAPAGGAG